MAFEGSEWKDEGTKRLYMEIPFSLWTKIEAAANKKMLRPTQLVRIWLQERAEEEVTEPAAPAAKARKAK